MLKQALQYLERGWPVVPCVPKSKIAKVKWRQYQDRLPERTSIETWFANPSNNIALITGRLSGIVVVDIDPQHGGDIKDVPESTLTVRTPGGGWHLYFKHPNARIGNSVGSHAPGIDVRGDGGYVMLPPSYVVVRDKDDKLKYEGPYKGEGTNFAIAPLPERFCNPAPEQAGKTASQTVAELLDAGVPEGGRNDAIAKIAGQFARKGMPVDTALRTIGALNRESFKPPLDEAEVETTVLSIYATHERRTPMQEHRQIELAGKPTGVFDVVDYAQYMSDNAPDEAQWLIPGWLLRETIALLVAPPGSYKTWLEFDMAVAIAGGLPFLDGIMPEQTGPVLIIQQEDHPGQNVERLSTIQHVREGIPTPKVYPSGEIELTFPTQLPILFHPDAKLRFGDAKVMTGLDKVLAKYRPAMVVIDPLYSTTLKTDDYMASTVQDMMVLKQMREAYGCTFIIGHHTSKGGSKSKDRDRLWGSQFLNGFLEQHIHLWKLDIGEQLVVRRGSKREGPEPACHVKFDISTKDPDMRYAISCEEITEEQADDLINPPKEGVTAIKGPPPLTPLAGELLKTINAAGPQDITAWSQDTGYALTDATKAAKELVKQHRAFESGGKYTAHI